MKTTKRLLAVVLSVFMIFSTVAVLAACDSSFDIDWADYVMTLDERLDTAGNRMPKVNSTNLIPANANVDLRETSTGLIKVTTSGSSNIYGYLIASDAIFGQNDDLISLTCNIYTDTYTYLGSTSDGTSILYDMFGNKLATGKYIDAAVVTETVGGRTTLYLQIDTINNDITSTLYRKINSDGTLDNTVLNKLPSDEDSLPKKGEIFITVGTTLRSWLDLEAVTLVDDDFEDAILDEVTVKTHGTTAVFYRDGKMLSEFTKPRDINALAYADGKIIYTTLTPVDSEATSGFNYVSGSQKYKSKTFSFNIKNGATKRLNVDYVITNAAMMYNRTEKAFDLAVVQVYRMVNGIAWAKDAYKDVLIVDKNGAIGFSYTDNPYGLPLVNVGKNYLTASNNIVNSKGKLVVSLADATLKSLISDGIVVTVDGKVGTIGFDGKVKAEFEYTLVNSIYGNYTIVTNKFESKVVLNLSTGTTTSLMTIANTSSDSEVLVDGYFVGTLVDNAYNWYLLDGTPVASNVSGSITVRNVTIFGHRYGFAQALTKDGTSQFLRFEF